MTQAFLIALFITAMSMLTFAASLADGPQSRHGATLEQSR